jgi:RNA recognition motif-containing protein
MSEEPEADYGAIGDVGDDGGEDFDADLAAMEAMQAEAENENSALQENVSSAMASATEVLADKEAKDRERAARDEKSVFVTNVHWEAKGEQVAEYFSSCGPVERVTIQQDKHGNAKG